MRVHGNMSNVMALPLGTHTFDLEPGHQFRVELWASAPVTLYALNDAGLMWPLFTGLQGTVEGVVEGATGLMIEVVDPARCAVSVVAKPHGQVMDPIPLAATIGEPEVHAEDVAIRRMIARELMRHGLTQEEADDEVMDLSFVDRLQQRDEELQGYMEDPELIEPYTGLPRAQGHPVREALRPTDGSDPPAAPPQEEPKAKASKAKPEDEPPPA